MNRQLIIAKNPTVVELRDVDESAKEQFIWSMSLITTHVGNYKDNSILVGGKEFKLDGYRRVIGNGFSEYLRIDFKEPIRYTGIIIKRMEPQSLIEIETFSHPQYLHRP
jgi:hypothetical protein